MQKLADLRGMTFGHLTVIGLGEYYTRPNGRREVKWRCRCTCGNIVDVLPRNLKTGNTTSCGCQRYAWRDYLPTEQEREKEREEEMSIPRPDRVTIQDELIIGDKYTIKQETMKLFELWPYFARFKKKDGTKESFSYWDLQKLREEGRFK